MKITPFLNVKKKDKVADIEIFGDIGYNVWADNFEDYQKNTSEVKAKEIKALQELDVEVINLTMESLGGDVSHALAIYSLLKNSGATINTYYRGANASASTIIGSAASSVNHIFMDNTGLFLVHKVMSYAEGNENDMQDAINEINYGVAELIDMRLDITRKTSDAMENIRQAQKEIKTKKNSSFSSSRKSLGIDES